MKLQFVSLMLISLFVGSSFAGLDGIIVNEIVPDPSGPSNNIDTDQDGFFESTDEYVEFGNTTGAAVDISGWQVYVEGGGTQVLRHTFSASSSIAAGEFLGLVTNWDSPTAQPANIVEIGSGTSILANGGDHVLLLNPATNMYASWIYNGATPTFTGLPAGAVEAMSVLDLGMDQDGVI